MATAPEHILIRNIRPRNMLSFGPEFPGLDLRGLNVIIGPNGSGKSNLIEAIGFMRAATTGWREATRKNGGVEDWIWKGSRRPAAALDWSVGDIQHGVEFSAVFGFFSITRESIERSSDAHTPALSIYRREDDSAILYASGKPIELATDLEGKNALSTHNSILSERRDPEGYMDLFRLAYYYETIRIYRDWSFGRGSVLRQPQRADERNDFLQEDFSNLGVFLSKLGKNPKAKRVIVDALGKLYEGVTDYNVHVEGGTVQVYFTEGDFSVPATRLSDGTIRFLCLLAILCDPEPKSGLVCIEEPELGLHPDILPTLADLMKSASERMQLIVTTHSDIIIDALSATPECVIVCEKHEGKTEMKRLVPEELADWLKNYRLGQLWMKGQLGGTRW